MRLISRNDASLAVGLIVGAIVVFREPLRSLFDVARDIEERYHFDLIPALTIMTGVFIFHEYRKRELARADARAAAADATRAKARAAELERLMSLSQALANALDVPTLQQVLWRYLPMFAGERECWVLFRQGRKWQIVIADSSHADGRRIEVLEAMADQVTSREALGQTPLTGLALAESVCFPMRVRDTVIGVLGVQNGAVLLDADRATIGAAAALIGIALKNIHLFGQTLDHSVHDGLTGCFNRDHALATLDAELRRAKRSGEPLSIIMFDVDHFKTINDELGHLYGDQILRALGAQLTRVLRSTDVRCRYGGDEFLIILPGTRLLGAEQVGENLRREVGSLTIATDHEAHAVSVSVGVTAAAPEELDVNALIGRADEALYQAKRAGRNRVISAVAPAAPSLSTSPADPAARGSAESVADGGVMETILVVDDEPFVREMIRRALEPPGYTVLSVGSGADAIAADETCRGPIHLLLTDVIMPDLQGPDLAQRIRSRRPEIQVVYMSGFAGQEDAEPLSRCPGASFLRKPFTGDVLLARIREQLGRAG